ncbi:MAG: hypothetical protein RJB37_817 [Pseudomonadota bacterium]|jgi:hypothetical protein
MQSGAQAGLDVGQLRPQVSMSAQMFFAQASA